MKLDTWEIISSIIEAGGVYKNGYYCVRNSRGQHHREGGPAVIYPNGSQLWCRNGHLHREGGPAVIYPNGSQYWYLNGKQIPTPLGLNPVPPDPPACRTEHE
jgi:hypothetical protein